MRSGAVLVLIIAALAHPAGASAEPAAEPATAAAGQLDAGGEHTCLLDGGAVRCWGLGFSGQLGYGRLDIVGDNETPGTAGGVDLGPGRSATAISAGDFHTCAVLDDGTVRCWGFGADGRLGYGDEEDVGDDETPGSAGPVDLGTGRTARAITAGGAHSCAILDTGSVLCWGFGGDGVNGDGRLGYGDAATIGDDETPGQLAPVNLGAGRTATAISAGREHTCAVLDDATVRCWGTNGTMFGGDGRLGYGNANTIGDNETPGSVDPVALGAGATAISAGDVHTCAVLAGGGVRCWGNGLDGRNGYGNELRIGDNETPASVGPVALGGAATAISAGNHTCARLAGGDVRCWGPGASGRLGYGNLTDIGDNLNETPATLAPVSLGGAASAISAGGAHTCALLAAATVRCWGAGAFGRLGYGDTSDIGDGETPASVGPVDLRTPVRIEDAVVREGDSGVTTATFTVRLSVATPTAASVTYATADQTAVAPSDYSAGGGMIAFAPGDTSRTVTVEVLGDTADESDEVVLVDLANPTRLRIDDPQGSATIIDDDTDAPAVAPLGSTPLPDTLEEGLRRQAERAAGLRACRASAASRMRTERSRARRRYRQPRTLARMLRRISRTAADRRRQCLRRFGRAPGRVTSLVARRTAPTTVVLAFAAPGSDGSNPPAARSYLVKQSLRPIRTVRSFERAMALCRGTCSFDVTPPGAPITLRVTGLRRRTTYHYAIVARDNVSARRGPRSRTVSIRTG